MSASTDRDARRSGAANYDSSGGSSRSLNSVERHRLPRLLYDRYNDQFDFDLFSSNSNVSSTVGREHERQPGEVGPDLAVDSPSLGQSDRIRQTPTIRSPEQISQASSVSPAPESMHHLASHSPALGQQQPGSVSSTIDRRSATVCSPSSSCAARRSAPSSKHPVSIGGCRHIDWEQCEERRVQELEEAKNRAAQMEKTMKWWAECTANWRQKWSNIRDERNKYREEVKHFKSKCDAYQANLNKLKDDYNSVVQEKLDLQSSLEKLIEQKTSPMTTSDYAPRTLSDNRIVRDVSTQCYISDKPLHYMSLKSRLTREASCNTIDVVGASDTSSSTAECSSQPPPTLPKPSKHNLKVVTTVKGGYNGGCEQFNDIVTLRAKLDEASHSLQAEQCENVTMKEKQRHLDTEIDMLKAKCEELEASKKAVLEELEDFKLTTQCETTASNTNDTIDKSLGVFVEDDLKTNENVETLDDISFTASCDDYVVDEEIETVYDEIDAEIEKEVTSLREKMSGRR